LLRKSREDALEAISIYYIPLLSLFFLVCKENFRENRGHSRIDNRYRDNGHTRYRAKTNERKT
jgi:hypothetical protein